MTIAELEEEFNFLILKKDDLVLVKDKTNDKPIKAHFSHMKGKYYYCFNDGKTSWTSEEPPISWLMCEKVEDERDTAHIAD